MHNADEKAGYRLLPHSIEAEQGLLGALLIDNRAFDRVTDFLEPHHFFQPAHQRIFEAISQIIERGQTASPVTLKNLFDQDGDLEKVGGGNYLAELVTCSLGTLNTEHYAQQIYDLFLRRELVTYGESVAAQAHEQSLDRTALQTVEAAEEQLYRIASARHSSPEARPVIEGCERALQAIMRAKDGEAPCIKTGIPELDDKLGGLFPGELCIVAGRPAMGKTAFGLNIAQNAAAAGHKVLFFSLEMPTDQLAMRLYARETGISVDAQRKGAITDGQARDLQTAARNLMNLPLYIDDQAGLNVAQIRSRIRRHMRRQGAELIVIDYLGLIRPTNPAINRTYQIEEVTTGLKAAAKDFGVPVMLLAQINRGVESRDDKRPTMSDLKDSGAIEQDADAVMLLYRNDYYLAQKEPKKKGDETQETYEKRLAAWHLELLELALHDPQVTGLATMLR
jgi:replicative DNA helicase